MKLLLTSAGLRNQTIASALQALVGKGPEETKIGFVPTAQNVEIGNADWFIDQFMHLREYGFGWIDVVDPSADGVDWRTALRDMDVVMVGPGNTFHLLDQVRKTGFDTWVKENLETKVYVGISAGSILATPRIDVAGLPPGDNNLVGITDLSGMNLVNFEIEPHCEGERFATVEQYAHEHNRPVCAIDDQTAIQVVDNQVHVVSEGTWKRYS
jgi:dipeptidase E